MQIVGLPETFWVVTHPSPLAELGDICFECDFARFAMQIRGGLNEQEIAGIFAEQSPAVELAEKLLAAIRSITSGTNAHVTVSPWPHWCATQESLAGVFICDKASQERILLKPPPAWGRNWAWNIAEDGTGIVMRQTHD